MCLFFEEKWTVLSQGTFNTAYINQDRTQVLKVKKIATLSQQEINLDSPERSVRIWNEINKPLIDEGLIEPAKLHDSKKFGICWITPYIKPQTEYDDIRRDERSHVKIALNEIENRTGRKIVDADVHGNFLTIFDKNQNPRAVCIDVGLAYSDNTRPQSPESKFIEEYSAPKCKCIRKKCDSVVENPVYSNPLTFNRL